MFSVWILKIHVIIVACIYKSGLIRWHLWLKVGSDVITLPSHELNLRSENPRLVHGKLETRAPPLRFSLHITFSRSCFRPVITPSRRFLRFLSRTRWRADGGSGLEAGSEAAGGRLRPFQRIQLSDHRSQRSSAEQTSPGQTRR